MWPSKWGQTGPSNSVDGAAKRTQGNSFAAWKHVTPVHNELVDTIIASSIHVLVSMRTKTEWVIEKDERTGKSAPRKVGLAPVMRDGIEFEFDVCGDLDQDNTLTVTKSRCPELAGKVINRPGKDMAQVLKKWLAGAPAEPKPAPAQQTKAEVPAQQPTAKKEPFEATDDDIPSALGGTYEPPCQQNPAEKRIEEMRQRNADDARQNASAQSSEKPWTTFKGMIQAFQEIHQELGSDAIYYRELDLFDVKHANEFRSTKDALACYQSLQKKLASQKEQAA